MEKLHIYQNAIQLLACVYELISQPLLKTDFALKDQLQRAALSIVLNIAEGYGLSQKLFSRHLKIAAGSANETLIALKIVAMIHHIDTLAIQERYLLLAKQITACRKRIELASQTQTSDI